MITTRPEYAEPTINVTFRQPNGSNWTEEYLNVSLMPDGSAEAFTRIYQLSDWGRYRAGQSATFAPGTSQARTAAALVHAFDATKPTYMSQETQYSQGYIDGRATTSLRGHERNLAMYASRPTWDVDLTIGSMEGHEDTAVAGISGNARTGNAGKLDAVRALAALVIDDIHEVEPMSAEERALSVLGPAS